MAATESDPLGASPLLRRPRRSVRLTLRVRLTLLYGSVFIAAGAGLLTATYLLFKHSQNTSPRRVAISGVQFQLPKGAAWRAIITSSVPPVGGPATQVYNDGAVTREKSGTSGGLNTVHVPPQQILKEIQASGQTQLTSGVTAVVRRANLELKASQESDASSLLEWSAIALGVVALLSIALSWWLAGRALRPLRTMNTRAREISAENLHERLGVEARGDELGELAGTFDALLARLEAAFDSQRRFVANASHELRTPITLERTLIEVALADPDASIESLRRVCERVVSSTEEQERLLDALLTLARSEAGVTAGESVDLAVLVEDALLAREVRLMAVTVESSLQPAPVVGDRALLERLVGNLVENAILHNGGEQPWLRVTTDEAEGSSRLRIANSGTVIAPDQVDELFEPFRRGAGERLGNDDHGLGLGLSIVRAVAVAHGAQIEAHGLPGGGLELELRFSSAAAARPTAAGLEPVSV